MRSLFTLIALILLAFNSTGKAQEVYTNSKSGYSLELPSPTWRMISHSDAAHEHTEFVYGDRLEGYLQIRKEVVDPGVTPSELARRDRDQRFRYLPGFIEGKEERFAGRMNGITMSYEFVRTGKPMLGRIYYLQTDDRTVYALRFSGLRDKLNRIRNQTDLIARSFQLN